MNNKQVLVYGLLESTNDLRSIFGTHPFQKTYEISKMYWNISLLLDQAQEQEIRFLLIIFIDKNHFKKGQPSFKKHFKFHNFSEMFYCGMTRPRKTNLSVFIQSQYTRTILKNKNMEQSLFKKHSKFQKFNEILYCGMTRFRNVELSVFRKYQNRNYFRKKKYGRESF